MEAFKPGDKVRRIKSAWGNLKVGDIRTVERCVLSVGEPGLILDGDDLTYTASMFELVTCVEDAVMALYDPVHQPFNYPETDEDRERAARAKLRAYKRGMRDWLYGTTSEDQS